MKLILKITAFFAFIFFLQNILFSSFPNIPSDSANQIDSTLRVKPDVILLGDSVIITPYSKDTDGRPVNLMLREKISNIKLSSLDSLAYASEVFLQQIRYITIGTQGMTSNLKMTQNINLIKNSLNKYPVKVLDLSFKLPAKNFAWKDHLYINEHLNQNGRQFLAQELANSIIDSLKNNQ